VPHVFAYGSLARAAGAALPCRLLDHRRTWGVAMDNRLTIPGYKVYIDPLTGEQPPLYVAFLDVRPQPGGHVDGVAFPIEAGELPMLDRRERQYERHDVSEHVVADLGGRVWAYLGRAEARRRCALGPTVIARQYLEKVRADFDSFGMLDEFERTTEPPAVPVLDLERVDVRTTRA
jgi:cation transport regulator ChaC